ncbi:MAG: hypothetical protein ACF8XB_01150 [Planctomycetota bacterium JB042]
MSKKTTAELRDLIAKKFPSPAYVHMHEVRNATGFARKVRSADMLVMSTWPSHGLTLRGFEIKRDRSDWLREVQKPEKAEEIARFCDQWWVVANADVVRGELPKGWGLMVPHGKGLRVVSEPDDLDPQPITREFLASVLRAATTDVVPRVEHERRVRAARDEERAHADERVKREFERRARNDNSIATDAREFMEKTGIDLTAPWHFGDVSEAIEAVKRTRSVERVVERAVRSLESHRDEIERGLAALRPDGAAVASNSEG